MTLTLPPGVAINAPILPGFETILTWSLGGGVMVRL